MDAMNTLKEILLRLMRTENCEVYITGSSAQMLSFLFTVRIFDASLARTNVPPNH
jgi:hypothetical protein